MKIKKGTQFGVIPEWIIYAPISAQAIRLYLVLSRYADNDGECYPSHSTLGKRMGVSVSTVKRAIKELEKINAVEVINRMKENGDYSSNLYRLNIGKSEYDLTPRSNMNHTPSSSMSYKLKPSELKPFELKVKDIIGKVAKEKDIDG